MRKTQESTLLVGSIYEKCIENFVGRAGSKGSKKKSLGSTDEFYAQRGCILLQAAELQANAVVSLDEEELLLCEDLDLHSWTRSALLVLQLKRV